MDAAEESYPEWPNLAAMMFARARQWPERAMLRHFREGAWQGTTWGRFGRQAAAAARALRAAGVAAGDRVLIVSENRPEFPIAETALLAIRAVPVPAYITYTPADFAHLLQDSGARMAIVSTAALAARVLDGAAPAGGLDLLVTIEAPPAATALRCIRFDDLLRPDLPQDDIEAEAAAIAPGALACLIYTSGTGGAPRGVMLPHRAILANCRGVSALLRRLHWHDEVYLSFLPLSHSFEHTAGQFCLLSAGAEVVYARGVEHLAADLLTARPTIITMVPRILELIRSRVLAQVAREPAWRQRLFHRALAIGVRRLEGGRLGLADRLLDPLLDRLVRRRVLARFGGRLRLAVSGGARLEPEVARFFLGLGMNLLQGYGQTEAGPVVSVNLPWAIKTETVGPPLDGVSLRIAKDGEILVAGDLVMEGYWGQPEATAAAIRDGWLHTGDIGQLDADGYLRITDRKRDIIVLSGGDNVSPARIEGALTAEPEIAQAVVVGDGQSALAALLVPTPGTSEGAVAHAVARVNARLAASERVRRHTVVPPFTIENGLLTPTQKIRRALVFRAHASALGLSPG